MMRKLAASVAGVILGSVVIAVPLQAGVPPIPPSNWELFPNDPDPFCVTRIQFAAPQSAHVRLVVLDSGSETVRRTLIDGMLAVGLFSVIWDGLDQNQVQLADGPYTLRLTAVDARSNPLFDSERTVHLQCYMAVLPVGWARIKQLYR